MNINNLVFFDKNGESYNFSQDSNGVWSGSDYFLPISTALYDVSNLFILEKVGSDYKFPVMEENSKFILKWKTAQYSDNFFLFTIAKEDPHTDSTTYIERQKSITINYSDFGQGGGDLDLAYPFQINVGFSPLEEVAYTRTLEIYYETASSTTKVLSLDFYGEGEDEDERFRVWLSNFGIKFNREDALLLKDYDLKEGLPDWKQINQARKQLLVNRDQIYPYVGTYKGLINLIDILGYRDVLRVKEYWRDADTNSAYYNKYAMVDVTDLMTAGSIDSVDLVDLNGQIKKGGKFRKTEFLALAYEFSVATDTYDDDGVPNVEFTTKFEVDEIFYKLNRLATKLKTEILPVNVIIKDIIGEFIYFNKFNLRDWSDVTYINALEVNDPYVVTLNYPVAKNQSLAIRDIKALYPLPSNTSYFPNISFNETLVQPYENGQKYDTQSIPGLLDAIAKYYILTKDFEFQHHGETNPIFTGDDMDGKIGCPVYLESYLPDFMLRELDGCKFGDFTDTHFTIGNIRYRNGIEIEWTITGPQGYVFNWRGNLTDLVKLPHVLPHTGQYTIKSVVYDMQGGQNVSFLNLTVNSEDPVVEVFTKIQDKSSYRFKDLTNLTLGDLADSPLYLPFANVTQHSPNESKLSSHYLDWYTYFNNFGLGNPQGEAEIYTEGIGFESISTSQNPLAKLWGTGSVNGQPSLADYGFSTIGELSLNRMSDLTYAPDKINGFILNLVDNPGETIISINFGGPSVFQTYGVAPYSTAEELANNLNSSSNVQVSEYTYVAINGNVHAMAKVQNNQLNRILTVVDSAGEARPVYTFSYPQEMYSYGLIDSLNANLAEFKLEIDDQLLFLDAPFSDILRKTGETCYSTTSHVIPSSFPTLMGFYLTKLTDFDQTSEIRAYSLSNPSNWVQGTWNSTSDNTTLVLQVTSSNGATTTVNDWAFNYVTNVPDSTATQAPASFMQYWLDKGFISYNELTPNFELTGFLPSTNGRNAFNLTNIKIGPDGLTVPLFQPVFAAVSNIYSKKSVVWTIYHAAEEIAKIRSTSYFIWKFDEPGEYSISVEVTDSNNNVYTTTKPVNIVHANKIEDYRAYLENTLNRRKAVM